MLQALDSVVVKLAEDRLPREPGDAEDRVLLEVLGFYDEFAQANAADPVLSSGRWASVPACGERPAQIGARC